MRTTIDRCITLTMVAAFVVLPISVATGHEVAEPLCEQ